MRSCILCHPDTIRGNSLSVQHQHQATAYEREVIRVYSRSAPLPHAWTFDDHIRTYIVRAGLHGISRLDIKTTNHALMIALGEQWR